MHTCNSTANSTPTDLNLAIHEQNSCDTVQYKHRAVQCSAGSLQVAPVAITPTGLTTYTALTSGFGKQGKIEQAMSTTHTHTHD